MTGGKGEAGAKQPAPVLLGGEPASYSENQPEKQAVTYQRVSGDLGPIHLIGSPRVVVETHATKAFVWIENKPWGWPELRREFLNRESPKVARYAKSLALMIQAAALKEEQRRGRLQEARWQERIGRERGQ